MTEIILKQCILRLKTDEVFPLLRRWSFLNQTDLDRLKQILDGKHTKRDLAVKLQDYCNEKGGLTHDCVGELDLMYIQQCSTKRIWSAYNFTGPYGRKTVESPVQIKRKMTKYLRLYFHKDCCVSVMLHNGLLWGRVYLPKTGVKGYQSTRCLYFVHYPQTSVIVVNGMRSSYSEFMTQCFVGVFGYTEITDMSLTGHHQESLAELAINKYSEGGYTRFRRERRLSGPVDENLTRKRKVPEEVLDDRIVDENRENKRLRLEILDKTFGENVQPMLEKIEYRVELPYRGQEVAEELKNNGDFFMGKVVFQGSNVLEGLRNLGEHGYASVPLPKFLTCVPTRARNYFLLSKTRKDGENTNKTLNKSDMIKSNKPQSDVPQSKRPKDSVQKGTSTAKIDTSPRTLPVLKQNSDQNATVRRSPRRKQ